MKIPETIRRTTQAAGDPTDKADYRTRVYRSIADIGESQWDLLLPEHARRQPFVRHAFLSLLESTGCVGGETGWLPLHLGIEQAGELVAVAPLYAKTHSYGEYVFDWAWAEAYQRHGLRYYPKLLSAIPFSPVPGPRLLARDDEARDALARAMVDFAGSQGLSSLHVLFPQEKEASSLVAAGATLRHGVQFHWQNEGWRNFDDFLNSLRQDKRKKIRAERRRVADSGISFRRLGGAAITEADWQFFYRCYAATYRAHHSTPYLNEAFFLGLGEQMSEAALMIIASEGSKAIAVSLLLHDGRRLYGRHWGAEVHRPMLHFETCYYQAIEHAIEQGFEAIEGGAQGEHKMARGFVPVRTVSAHWLAEPAFADAVERYLDREGQAISGYMDELSERTPFRSDQETGR
jgi:predicted N-acyltransferase